MPDNHRKWIKDALAWSNEPRLQQRLDELLDRYGSVLGLDDKQREQLARNVKNTRNFHVHYDKRLEGKALTGIHLHSAIQQLKKLLEAILLDNLGFTQPEIKGMLQWK